jgi:predicted hotdog family 3-hydroxylacyl-ACP dehydratase
LQKMGAASGRSSDDRTCLAVNVTLDRREIEHLLPQKGAMCLIDSSLATTGDCIVCAADASRDDHPLREGEGVSVVHAVEYGAQAAALHRLVCGLETGPASGGLLLRIRKAQFFVQWLDRLPQPLRISAQCLQASSEAATYCFEISAGETLAASGELTLKLT